MMSTLKFGQGTDGIRAGGAVVAAGVHWRPEASVCLQVIIRIALHLISSHLITGCSNRIWM